MCLRLCMSPALQFALLRIRVCVRNETVLLIDSLSFFARIDNHDEADTVVVIHRVILQLYVCRWHARANPPSAGPNELICEELIIVIEL